MKYIIPINRGNLPLQIEFNGKVYELKASHSGGLFLNKANGNNEEKTKKNVNIEYVEKNKND